MPSLLRYYLLLIIAFCPLTSLGQVSAGFSVDNASGCTPLVVHFTNTSFDAVTYNWNLGNSTSSTLSDPSAVYTTAGSYTVTLTAYNGSASSTHSMVITVYPLPTVNFTASATAVCPGVAINYNNSSTGGVAGPMTYTWNFGDGSTSSITSPSYTHSSSGFYSITLYATNSKGCSKSLTKPSYIRVYDQPSVAFSGSGTSICNPPSAVAFTNSSSGYAPLYFNWSFGDGFSSSATNPVHTYASVGSSTVRLKVTDGHGCIDSSVFNDYVVVSGISASFTAPTGVCAGSAAAFSNSSMAHVFSIWNFGDGYTSTEEDPTHVYNTAGTFNTRLIVTDGACYDTAYNNVTINPVPAASFTINPTVPCPAPVTVSYAATVPPGCSANWLFFDPSIGTGTGVSPSQTYIYGSIDTVVLTVTNSNGCVRKIAKVDTIYNLKNEIVASAPLGCVPLTTSFTSALSVTSYFPPSNENIPLPIPYTVTSYQWNFGDGSPTYSGTSPVHTYTTVGTFNVTCTITTTSGCVRTGSVLVKAGLPPVVTFAASATHLCAGKIVNFVSTATPGTNSYKWLYGDGEVDTGNASFSSRAHRFKVPGIDTVELWGFHNGCPGTPVKMPIYLDSPNAVPVVAYQCIPKNVVIFGDSSLGTDARLWLFGDGTTSTLKNPVHTYGSLTDYYATLTTYNALTGCRDTVTEMVSLTPPFVYFSTPDQTICVDDEISLYSTVGGTVATRFHWYDNGSLMSDSTLTVYEATYSPGLHDLTLVIKDGRECFDTFSRNDYLLVGNPIDSFTVTPSSGCGPMVVNFTDHSTGIPECRIKNYAWTYGDGATSTSATAGATHTYTLPGSYNVALTVTDSIGCTSTTASPANVQVYKPTASYYADLNNVCMGSAVHFNNTSSGIVSSFWMFGDGNTSTATSPNHVYSSSGVYTIKLVVTDSHGCTDTGTLLNYIYVAPSPIASFTMSDTFAVCPPLNVSFTNTSTSAVSYNWSFGNSSSSVAVNPVSPYNTAGYYTVRMVALNSIGCTDTAYGHVNIFGYDGAFSFTPESGCAPLPVHFTAPLGNVASLVWDFGDGVISSVFGLDTISHIYLSTGGYVPKLILTDSTGCTNTSISEDTIKVDIFTPHFSINPNPVCQGSSVTFTDSSYSYYATSASWSWLFDDGGTSTLSSTGHTFATQGVHSGTLSVTNSIGCAGSVVRTVTVNTVPGAIVGVAEVCRGFTTALSNPLSGGVWSSSNGAVATVNSAGLVYGVTAGTTSISYTMAAGCATGIVVTVNAPPGAVSGPAGICAGATGTFASSPLGGVWSSSQPTVASVQASSGIVTGLSAGTSVISYSSGSGCTATKIVTINTSPGGISGPDAVCRFATIALSNSVSGGVWSSSLPGVATISTGGVLYGLSAGTTAVSYTMPGTCFDRVIVTVNPLPAPISGFGSVCAGASVTFGSSPSGGAWSSSDPTVATVSALGNVTGLLAGVADITYTLPTGCQAAKSLTVNLSPDPIAGSLSICQYTTTTLTNAVGGGVWSSSTPAVASINTGGVVTGVLPGTASVYYSMPGACVVGVVVTVQPLPGAVAGVNSICEGATTIYTNSTMGGSWSSSDIAVATVDAATGAVAGIAAGTTAITYAPGTGCSASKVVTVLTAPTNIAGAAQVCVGAITSLASSPTTGVWSSSTPSAATVSTVGAVYGIVPGTTGITYSLTNGCKKWLEVTVNPLPAAIAGDAGVCYGAASLLTNSTPMGTWSSSDALVAIVHPVSGVLLAMTTGTATISYTLGTGCYSVKEVTVNVVPAPITGTRIVCEGANTTLYQSISGGSWMSGNTAVATVNSSGVVTGIAGGTADITYAFATGCGAVATVTVNSLPDTIAGNPQLCIGLVTTLTNSSAGGLWSSSDPVVAPVSGTGIVYGNSLGSAFIYYTLATGCTRSLSVTVNSVPAAITGVTNACVGGVIHLSDATPGGAWTSGNVAVATIDATTGDYTGIAGGIVEIAYTMPSGCFATITLSIDALPPPIGGGNTVCAGFALNLTNSLPGGVWSSDPLAAGVGTIHPVTGVVTGISPGTVAISYTVLTGCVRGMVVTVLPLPSAITGSPNLCEGATTILSNATGGGTWSVSDPARAGVDAASGAITGLSSGSVVVTYKLGTGCINVLHIQVNPVPAPISGPDQVCEGGIIPLGSATTGGVWISTNTPVATITPSAGQLTGIAAGTALISFRLITGCAAVKVITVNATPPAITGNLHVCWGGLETLGNAMAGGTWLSSNSSVATIGSATGVVTPIMLGTSVISYVLTTTGCSASAVVTVQPLPQVFNVTGGGSYCSGGTGVHIGLDNSQTGVSYALHLGGIAAGYISGTGFAIDFGSLTTSGVYTVQATNAVSGCQSNMTGSATVSINPLVMPVVTIAAVPGDTVCPGTTVSLLALPYYGGTVPSFIWKVNSVVVGSGASYSFIPADGDVVAVTMASIESCVITPVVTGTKIMTVLPNATPMVHVLVSPGDTICEGRVVTLSAAPMYGGGHPLFYWRVNGNDSATGSTYSYIPSPADEIVCMMVSDYQCAINDTATSETVVIKVEPQIIPHVTLIADPGLTVNAGHPVTLRAVVTDAGPAPTYQWRLNGVPVAGATTGLYTRVFNDYDSIVCAVTSSGVCDGITSFDWAFISVESLGVSPQGSGVEINLIPNPNSGSFTLSGTLPATIKDPVTIQVTDMLGQIVYSGLAKVNGGQINESVSLGTDLSNGMYILTMELAGDRRIFHFVLNR